ncbi:MAG: DNA glycosylase AlkZ-like family protein, partial [Solirubrobacteraceae bacterium]
MQSQDYPGATWALAQRLDGWTRQAIDAAFDAGEMIRTHVLRPTWHFVAPEDLRWLLALTGPRLQRGDAHRQRALDIDDALVTRSMVLFERAIAAAGPRTRAELRAALADSGIDADAGRLGHLLFHAELAALLCSGPRRGAAQTYALVDARVPPSVPRPRDEALAQLAGRYVRSHGPAQDIDLAWWSG